MLRGAFGGILAAADAIGNRAKQHTRVSNKKAPLRGLLRISSHSAQCESDQTFFLVKYIRKAKMIRNTNTWKPRRLRASMWGSAVHIRNVVTSLEYCATVVGEPSS